MTDRKTPAPKAAIHEKALPDDQDHERERLEPGLNTAGKCDAGANPETKAVPRP